MKHLKRFEYYMDPLGKWEMDKSEKEKTSKPKIGY